MYANKPHGLLVQISIRRGLCQEAIWPVQCHCHLPYAMYPGKACICSRATGGLWHHDATRLVSPQLIHRIACAPPVHGCTGV